MSAHYSHPIDYTAEKIDSAKKQLKNLEDFFGRVEQLSAGKKSGRESAELKNELQEAEKKFLSAMDDDFNMPQALGWVYDLLNKGNQCIAMGDIAHSVHIRAKLSELLTIFGIQVNKTAASNSEQPADIQEQAALDIDKKITERVEARRSKDFKRADEIRKDLELQGIILEDTSSGTIWRKK